MEEPGDGLHEEQRHGRGYGEEQTSLAFGSGWTALGCYIYIYIYIYRLKTITISIMKQRKANDVRQ